MHINSFFVESGYCDMKRKTLRERQQKIADREMRKDERLRAKGFRDEPTPMDMEEEIWQIPTGPEDTLAAMHDLAAKFGIDPDVEIDEKLQSDDINVSPWQDNEDEVAEESFDPPKKKEPKYQSRDNGKLFKFYNINLLLRVLIFAGLIAYAVTARENFIQAVYLKPWTTFHPLMLLWLLFVVAIIVRFIPDVVHNPGYQKIFGRYFIPSADFDDEYIRIKHRIKHANKGAWKVLGVWVAVCAVIGVLYFNDIIDVAVLVIISAFFAVADVICILYYCPFQHLFMKNRCCMNCRIYNWDFLMICSPLIFIRSWLTWSLVLIALIVFIRWEYVYKNYPERFFAATNNKLRCVSCSSKLCRWKFPATATARNLFGRGRNPETEQE